MPGRIADFHRGVGKFHAKVGKSRCFCGKRHRRHAERSRAHRASFQQWQGFFVNFQGEIVVSADFLRAPEMVEMRVGEQDMADVDVFLFGETKQFFVLLFLATARIDNHALAVFAIHHIEVHLDRIHRKTFHLQTALWIHCFIVFFRRLRSRFTTKVVDFRETENHHLDCIF